MSTEERIAPSTATPPASKRTVPVVIVALVLVVLVCGLIVLRRAQASVNQVALSDNPKVVTVVEVRDATFRENRRYIATIEPWLKARLGPQLASGFVDSVLVRPGAEVKKGTILATLDCRNASIASRALAHTARALAERQKATAREASRLGELLDGGYAAPNEVEQKRAESAASEAQLASLLAQGSGKVLEVNDCVIRAPFAGEVSVRLADPGTFVRPGEGIVEIVDRAVVRLTASVPEVDFDAVAPRTPLRVRLLSTGKVLAGEISRRAPAADLSTRTVRVEVDLQNEARAIPVGTTAELRVDVGEPMKVLEVPLLAAKIRGQRATLFVVQDGIARKVAVDLVGERGRSAFLSPAGLAAGDLVVTQGRSLLASNDRVAAKLDVGSSEAGE